MVRVAGLWDQFENGINKRDAAGLTVKQQLAEISKSAHDQMRLLNKYLLSLIKELRAAGIYICRVSDLSEGGRRWLEGYYQEEIFPVLTPMAVDASRPFPFLANKTLNLAVELTNQEGEDSMGIVQVPSVLPRLIEVPGEENAPLYFWRTLSTSTAAICTAAARFWTLCRSALRAIVIWKLTRTTSTTC